MIDWTRRRQPCPACDRGPKDDALGVTVNADGSAIAHCFRCEYVETSGGMVNEGRQAPSMTQRKHEVLSEYGQDLWASAVELGGDALAYLKARGCVIPPPDGDLRWHPALRHPVNGVMGPALVALVTDAVTGEPLTLHRTWVRADGTKAPHEPARMLLGGHRKAGGVVRLWPDEAVTTGLCVTEGIETALSVAHGYRPVWACIDAGNLAALPVLDGVEALVIAADHDDTGVTAAHTCAKRWAAAGRCAGIVMPLQDRSDFNDLVRAQ